MSTCSSHTHRHRCLHTSTQVHTPRKKNRERRKGTREREQEGKKRGREEIGKAGRQTCFWLRGSGKLNYQDKFVPYIMCACADMSHVLPTDLWRELYHLRRGLRKLVLVTGMGHPRAMKPWQLLALRLAGRLKPPKPPSLGEFPFLRERVKAAIGRVQSACICAASKLIVWVPRRRELLPEPRLYTQKSTTWPEQTSNPAKKDSLAPSANPQT